MCPDIMPTGFSGVERGDVAIFAPRRAPGSAATLRSLRLIGFRRNGCRVSCGSLIPATAILAAMVTHRFKLDDIEKAHDLLARQQAGVLTTAITP